MIRMSKRPHYLCLIQRGTGYNMLIAHRVTYRDEDNLKTDCATIKNRSFFGEKLNSKEEANFPIAYAKLVYKDYLFLEMELSAEYAPQNFYCFSIDKKSPALFHDRIKNLANCLPNVFIVENKYVLERDGTNHIHAYLDCLKVLSKFCWKYVILLQNHDIILRTNIEIVQIFKWLNGVNDISTNQYGKVWDRINLGFNWTFSALNLFKDRKCGFLGMKKSQEQNLASKNLIGKNGFPAQLAFAKSMIQTSLSREFVDFILNDLNLQIYIKQLEWKRGVSPEESFFAILHATDALGAPGGFTHVCRDKNISVASITRQTIWKNDQPEECKTNQFRHGICIFGVEDLSRLSTSPHLFVNKMMPDFDFAAILCWHERLYDRLKMGERAIKLNSSFYLNQPHVSLYIICHLGK